MRFGFDAKHGVRRDLAVATALAVVSMPAMADDWPWATPVFEEITGNVAIEGRLFAEPQRFIGQERHSGP